MVQMSGVTVLEEREEIKHDTFKIFEEANVI